MRTVCPARSGDIAEAYDCSGNDYFNPSPAPGSYLATHWNVYDSAFLEPAPPAGAPAAPVAYRPPTSSAPTAAPARLRAPLLTPSRHRVGSASLRTGSGRSARIAVQLGAGPRRGAGPYVLRVCAWGATADGRAVGAPSCHSQSVHQRAVHGSRLAATTLHVAAAPGVRASVTVLTRDGRRHWRRFAGTGSGALSAPATP
jgi:hypothetical protein